MVFVPVGFALFFMDLMSEGLPLRAPVAVVDLDDSSLSRRVVRNLSSSELVDVAFRASSYAEALELVKSGKAYGFFIIPRDFMADAVGGRAAELSFYSDLTFFIWHPDLQGLHGYCGDGFGRIGQDHVDRFGAAR